ncbi:hypothetical protein KDA_17950 [Dictyobacter alpinus]|uniref:GTPase-associated protein 1 N-terminal domain-containing protein n=1 Tax=Dictyobacter alpinus TaxID=2014873 RepID=A0A402B4P5_9CHLR|nr:hypothetical protein [Dictyobacter alpinus]GCE26311.1 hypothetical protein KDA_17950 [Dictyobacter alpinus]
MKTESEQLWYAWSTEGPGGMGFKIRAASPGLMEEGNAANPASERIQAFLKHARYVLPQNTKDSADVPFPEAPVSLAFVRVQQEFILLQKTYSMPEGVSRSGNAFTHLLSDLPRISTPAGPLPFTAREAISVWGSSYWKTYADLNVGQTELPRITFPTLQEPGTTTTESDKVREGSLNRDALKLVSREQLEFILRAFLMHQPGQRIYIAAEPEVVARLLWGLTHSLPRTLEIMGNLTFSTYERLDAERVAPLYGKYDEAPGYPTITGTCWPASSTGDLPTSYYQDQGINGYALNSYTGRSTSLLPDSVVARFVLFAVDCLLDENNHNYQELTEILKQAELENCRELAHFMRVYLSYQETLSQNDVQELILIVKQRLDDIVDQEKSLLADLARLRRPNVQRSIVQWIARNRSWWENICRNDLVTFFACLAKYANYPLPSNIQHIIDTLRDTMNELGNLVAQQVNEAISNNTMDSMYFWMDMLDLTAPLHQCAPVWLTLVQGLKAEELDTPIFQPWWQVKSEKIFVTIHQTFKQPNNPDLETVLTPFGKIVANKLLAAIHAEDRWGIDNWQDKLIKVAPPDEEPAVWLYVFENLITNTYNSLYWEWWNAYGKYGADGLSQLGRQNAPVNQKLAGLGDLLINNIVAILQQDDPFKGMQSSASWPIWSIWNEMLSALIVLNHADVESCRIWLDLWGNLWPYIFTPTYEQWWQRQGAEVSNTIRQCAELHPQCEVEQNLSIFIFESILPLTYDQIDLLLEQEEDQGLEDPRNNLFILLRVLLSATPKHHQEAVWLDTDGGLLEYLSQTIQITVDDFYPWEMHRTLLESWTRVTALQNHPALYPWLNVSWDSIGRLIDDEQLPAAWHTIAIESVLLAPVTLGAAQLKALLSTPQHWQLFESVLQNLVQQIETAPIVINFFRHLIQVKYPHLTRVLGSLLMASSQLPETTRELLSLIQLTDTDLANFLEQDAQILLQESDWPESFTPLLTDYLAGLDAQRLEQPTTQAFLQRLQEREQTSMQPLVDGLSDYVQGWLYIAELLKQPASSKQWLRQARASLNGMLKLKPTARVSLGDVLWPILVANLTSELDLARILDNLSAVMTGTPLEQADTTTSTTLLLEMAPHVHAYYLQKQQVSRLLPYLKAALEHAQEILYPDNETFLESFYQRLFGEETNFKIYELITIHSELWPTEYKDNWQSFARQQRARHIERILAIFKEAIQEKDVEEISQAYQQVLKEVEYPGTRVNQQERDIALLAGDIVSAYKLQDPAALHQAHQELQQSPYKDQIHYTPEIEYSIANLPEVLIPKSKATRPLLKHRNSQMLTKIAAQPNAEILKALEQSVQETNARTSIGTVQSKSIMLDQLNKIHAFKRLYIGYRITIVDNKIKNTTWNSKDRAYYKKEKRDLHEWHRQTDQFLRQKSLHDLIDNVFINAGIETRIKQGQCGIEEFLLEPRVLEQFRQFQPDDYDALINMYNFSETDVKQVLRIFRRRERFAERLLKERYDLDSWLDERKKLYKDQINIELDW